MRRLSPLAVALLWCGLLVVGGIAAIIGGYVMVARSLDEFDQIPAMVSGGIGGIALIITGCVFGYVQVSRACTEHEASADDELLARIGALAEIERRRSASPKPRARRTTAKRVAS